MPDAFMQHKFAPTARNAGFWNWRDAIPFARAKP
jgi:hypothetical protein